MRDADIQGIVAIVIMAFLLIAIGSLISCGGGDYSVNPCGVCEAPKVCMNASYHVECTSMGVRTKCLRMGFICEHPNKMIKQEDHSDEQDK